MRFERSCFEVSGDPLCPLHCPATTVKLSSRTQKGDPSESAGRPPHHLLTAAPLPTAFPLQLCCGPCLALGPLEPGLSLQGGAACWEGTQRHPAQQFQSWGARRENSRDSPTTPAQSYQHVRSTCSILSTCKYGHCPWEKFPAAFIKVSPQQARDGPTTATLLAWLPVAPSSTAPPSPQLSRPCPRT